MQKQEIIGILDRQASVASMRMLFVAIALFAQIVPAHADGGALQFQRAAGPFIVTVFTTPSPLRAGPVDISLLVQDPENQQPVLDCRALVQLHKDGAMSVRSEATHAVAQNKLLYAAQVNVPAPGPWGLEVAIEHGHDSLNIAGEITVGPSAPVLIVYWRSLALPPLFISLFALNQWRKRSDVKGGIR